MTITPLLMAQLSNAIYAPIAPGTFDHVLTNGNVTVGVKKIGAVTTLTFAGTEDLTDLWNDLTAIPFDHPELKTIHKGFWVGVQEMFDQLKPYLTGLIALAGHSLGCPHAAYTAALCKVAAIPVQALYMFAPPRMSYASLPVMLQSWVEDIKAYRNAGDPVPGLPWNLLGLPWKQIVPQYIPLNAQPTGRAGLFAPHSCSLYIQGLTP